MTLYRRRLLCLLLALGMLITLIPLSGTSARAEEKKYGITLSDKVNLRYGAGKDQKIYFSLPANHVCEILSTKTVNNVVWYEVQTKDPARAGSRDYTGFLHGDFFRELTPEEVALYVGTGTVATPTPTVVPGGTDPTPTPTPVPAGQNVDQPAPAGSLGLITNSGTNLREGPGKNYHRITSLDRNTQVELLTIPSLLGAQYDTYYKVRYNNDIGYIKNEFLRQISGTVTPAPNITPTPVPGVKGYVKTKVGGCNLRATIGGTIIKQIDRNVTLPYLLDPVQKNGYTWYFVQDGENRGYLRGDLVKVVKDPYITASPTDTPAPTGEIATPTPTPTATVAPEPTGAPSILGYVKTKVGGCNLRQSMGGTVIKQIDRNVTLPYLAEPVQKNGHLWYYVQDGNIFGYLRGDVVTVVSGPVVTNTPEPTDYPTGVITPTPTPAVTDDPATGYVKTTSSGVNLRKKAGYTTPLGQVSKNVIMPYFGEPTLVKGVEWYYVKHEKLGYGYIHGDFVMKCNSDGSAVVTPTPAPTPTPEPGTTPAPSGATEASYTTLKIGSKGTAVKNLVTELKNQGYYTGSITSRYTTAVAEAVKAFQRAKGLTVDGVAGPATQHKLFGTVPIGAGDTSNLTMTLYPAEKIDWYTGGINELWARGSNYKVYDVKTGIVWWAHRWAGGLHVDAEPLTAADTARLCKCYGVTTSQEIARKNLYQRRPLLVTIGTRTFACSLYGVPHNYPDGDTIPDNEFRGQVCIHFTNSKTHDSRKVDSGHTEAIQYAWEHAPNGHK